MSQKQLLFLAVILFSASPALSGQETLDPESRDLLQSSLAFLAALDKYEVIVDEFYEADQDGAPARVQLVRDFKVQRPDRIFSNARGEGFERSFWYNRKKLVLLLKPENVYTEEKAPESLDALVDYLEEQYDLSNPLGTLLLGDGNSLIRRLLSANDGGAETLRGIVCRRLDLTLKTARVSLWIDASEKALPWKIVVVGNDDTRYEGEFRKWELSPEFHRSVFEFQPPEGSRKIDWTVPDSQH